MGLNKFGEKRVKKNIARLMIALFKSTDVDLCLTYVLAKKEIDKRGGLNSLIEEIDNSITKQDK